jgi:trehalose 6-phosphate synthase
MSFPNNEMNQIRDYKTLFFVSNTGEERSASGVVSTIRPLQARFGGTWISISTIKNNDEQGTKNLEFQLNNDCYNRFCNQGLWPLCHDVIVKPVFEASDFEAYRKVNQEFADAIFNKNQGCDSPLIFIHDYHLALLPELLRKLIPRAVIISFWHIPWPSLEQLQLCPWAELLVQSLANSNNLGFQTKTDSIRFNKALRKFLPDEEPIQFQTPHISHYPAAVKWPISDKIINKPMDSYKGISSSYQLNTKIILGLSIDRFDYTKGIAERLQSIEALYALRPELKEKLIFLQICISTRSTIKAFSDYEESVRKHIDRINQKLSTKTWAPIILVTQELDNIFLTQHYRAADFLLVSSLRDGMNLVAKEFIAAREDEMGVLVLSKYAGASEELGDAILFDPLDLHSSIEALNTAINMRAKETRTRMLSLRKHIYENDIYRWAAKQVMDAKKIDSLANELS